MHLVNPLTVITMNPPENSAPYIMGGYEYYPEDGNVFAFNTDMAPLNHGPNLWFNDPFQGVYINEADSFVFDSNPPLTSIGEIPGEYAIDKHYDNHANISSWISTASPIGLDLRARGTELDYGHMNAKPLDAESSGERQPNAGAMPCISDSAVLGRFPINGVIASHHGSPMQPHFGTMSAFSTPHSRVISTSTTNSSCPGSSSTLATPRFDPATHFAPLQYSGQQAPLLKQNLTPLFTPEMPDVFTTAPLVPPPINQTIRTVWPGDLPNLPGQSPAVVGYQQTSLVDAPQSPADGRSLRSTPSMESLRGSFQQQDFGSYATQGLLSPFGSSSRESISMVRTASAPGSFSNAHPIQEASRHKTRQPSGTWTSPFTNEPFVAGRQPNSEVKCIKRKPSSKMLFTAEPMSRSATAIDFATSASPIWYSSLGHNSQPTHNSSTMARSATMTDFQPGVSPENLNGWTSQVPQATPLKASFQAVNAIGNTITTAFTSIPAVRGGPNELETSNNSVSHQHDKPQYLTVPKGMSSRPTKKLPKRSGPSSAVQVTFMNFGPKDAKELTNAVAESGKSKRRRQEDSSSGEDGSEKSKRGKTSVASRL